MILYRVSRFGENSLELEVEHCHDRIAIEFFCIPGEGALQRFQGLHPVLTTLPTDTDCPWSNILRRDLETPGDTRSEQSLEQVRLWLDYCLRNHAPCGRNTSTMLPTRILDVSGDDPIITLRETNQQRAQYIALSHCWGPSQIIRTTTATLESHKRGVPLSALSNTFRDTVHIARALGIRYLWIDSLCIIQDSAADWECEAARMASVYSNAVLTISAVKSASGEGGLFSQNPEIELRGTNADGSPYIMMARRKIQHWYRPHTPLLSRGWVYQERLLSPRLLHFGEQELFWECMASTTCQCTGIGDAAIGGLDRYEDGLLGKQMYASIYGNSSLESVNTPDILGRLWRRMVREYSFLSLTVTSDKLPALLGLATSMEAYRNSRYLNGVWEDSLLADLLWFQIYPREARSLVTEPSWTWASVDGRIHFFDTFDLKESIVDTLCEVSLVTPDGDGDVEAGKLALRLRGEVDPMRGSIRHPKVVGGKTTIGFEDGRVFDGIIFFEDFVLSRKGSDVSDGLEVLCIPMALTSSGREYSLALKRLEQRKNVFERIGLLQIRDRARIGGVHGHQLNLEDMREGRGRAVEVI